jgi:beta-galactosidase
MAGANFGKNYEPDTTSYDYDAPLDEAGRPTPKFFAFRDVIQRHLPGVTLPSSPAPVPAIEIPKITLDESASLWTGLGQPIRSERPTTMEALGQAYGYILYRANVIGPAKGDLTITEVHDYAEVFVNGQRAGTLDRRLQQDHIAIELPSGNDVLDIFVENLGRINFGSKLRDDRKGITQSVALDGRELLGWEIYPVPMADLGTLHFSKGAVRAPAFYRGTFDLYRVGDTFLDTSRLEIGVAWVNGHNLGRFWNIGPQQTLYVPSPWLKKGKNEVIVFDLADDSKASLAGRRKPIFH